MKSIFSYENKVIQLLMKIADMAILNVLYIVCCIPIVTIGAAQAGLYSGIRQLMNSEDDRSCVPFFFKGLRTGFKQVTLVYLAYGAAFVLLAVLYVWLQFFSYAGAGAAPIWMCVVLMAVLAVFSGLIGPFHASFSCTTRQLFRNLFFVTMAYPFRSMVTAVFINLPLVLFMVDIYSLFELMVLWLALYYSMAFLLIHLLMRKPMEELKQEFLSQKQEVDEPAKEQGESYS